MTIERRPELDQPGLQAWEVTVRIEFDGMAHTIVQVMFVPDDAYRLPPSACAT